jgi:hypothetical protein
MKHIKTYEYILGYHKNRDSEVGDYVVINFHNKSYAVQIIEIIPHMDIWNYICLEYDGKKHIASKEEIMRHLLPIEIEQYEINKNTFKYNL